ncbi:hypothetical protein C2S52_006731 [Perilla frutescens var. hirtella]|nr:hypothetical protein C2S52_006731 [Perilla frutescens var. hirtella]
MSVTDVGRGGKNKDSSPILFSSPLHIGGGSNKSRFSHLLETIVHLEVTEASSSAQIFKNSGDRSMRDHLSSSHTTAGEEFKHLHWWTVFEKISLQGAYYYTTSHISWIPPKEYRRVVLIPMIVLILERSSRDMKHLRFNIRDRSIEFSPFDFALVMGLRFRTFPSTPAYSAFHTLLFDGRPNIRFDEIEDLFIGERNYCGRAGEIFLKLALLYIVYGVILYHHRLSKVVNTRYIHLVDDTQLFNSFPWGLLAYDHLVDCTHTTRDSLDCLLPLCGSQPIIDAHGYFYALQVWVYKMMPAVGQVCASMVFDWPLKIPRVLRWVTFPSVSRLIINELFASAELQVSADSFDEQLKMKMLFRHRPVAISAIASKTAETNISKKGKLPSPSDLVMDLNTLHLTLGDLRRLLSYPQLETQRYGQLVISPESVRVDTQNLSSSSESSFYLGPVKKKIFGSRCLLLDEDNDDATTTFVSSIVGMASLQCVLNFPLPTMMGIGVTRLWFDSISNPEGWLPDKVRKLSFINVTLVLLSKSIMKFEGALKQSDHTILFDQALPYVRGNSPQIGAMPLNVMGKIYSVGHMHESHWFLYEVSIDDQMITIYDSMSETLYWDVMVDELKYFSRNIPSLIQKSKIERLRNGLSAPLKINWELVWYKHAPQ